MLHYVNHAKHNYIVWEKFKPCFKFKQVLHIPPHPQAAVLYLWLDTLSGGTGHEIFLFNPLKPKLNPICYLLALLGAHHFLHVSRIRVKLLTFRLLMSYIYMEHPFLMFLDHTR